jgi:hypothetical protein
MARYLTATMPMFTDTRDALEAIRTCLGSSLGISGAPWEFVTATPMYPSLSGIKIKVSRFKKESKTRSAISRYRHSTDFDQDEHSHVRRAF